jgi:hypothetical protein
VTGMKTISGTLLALFAVLAIAGCTAPSQRVPRAPPPAPNPPIVAAPAPRAMPVVAQDERIMPLTMEQELDIAAVRRGS